jgi:hypothetical protein
LSLPGERNCGERGYLKHSRPSQKPRASFVVELLVDQLLVDELLVDELLVDDLQRLTSGSRLAISPEDDIRNRMQRWQFQEHAARTCLEMHPKVKLRIVQLNIADVLSWRSKTFGSAPRRMSKASMALHWLRSGSCIHADTMEFEFRCKN